MTISIAVIREYSFYNKSYMKSTVLIPFLYLQVEILVHVFQIQCYRMKTFSMAPCISLYDYATI